MKVVCICDAGVPEMLMQYMKKLPGCDVTLYTEKTLTDIKSLTTCERTAELRGAEACPVSAEMLEAVREAEILVTHVAPVNRAVLDAAPNVKIVGVLRTGTENVNLDLCRERGIAVYNAEGRNSTAVADLVVALMICEMRNIARAHGALVQGKWVKMFPNIMMNRDMCRCTVGIIGVGKIGTMVAARLKGFGCRILGCDIFLSPEEIEKRGCEPVSKEELLRQSDFVTIHMRHEAGQSALIGADELAMMKKNAILVNCARAGLVDTAALIEALRELSEEAYSEVGGADAEIVLVGREAGSGTRSGFEELTETVDKCKYRQELTSTGDVITAVAQNPDAIGYASLASVKDSVKALKVAGVTPSEETVKDGTYLIQRPFVLVTKEGVALSPVAQAFFDYATKGQANDIITASGVVPANG